MPVIQLISNILAACLSNELTQAILVALVLGFFGCMRPEEVQSVKTLQSGDKP
jgi:hypothetical protein